jgi:hypothetical protein
MEGGEGNKPQPIREQSGSGETFGLDKPVDLVGNIRTLAQQERARRTELFDPAWWLRGKLNVIVAEAAWQDQPKEKQQFFDDLSVAWDLVAYEQIQGENNMVVFNNIRGYSGDYNTKSVTLNPLGVTLLDAMAEALDIPHRPGQAKYDISLFSDQAVQERIRSDVSRLAPTAEEVKRAIATSVADEK